MAKVKFMTWDCKTVCGQYKNGNTAIQLVDAVDGEPIATATVNMGEKLERNMAYIKTWSENDGMLNALYDANIIKRVVSIDRTGYVSVPLCEIDLDVLGIK